MDRNTTVYVLLDAEDMNVIGVYTTQELAEINQQRYMQTFGIDALTQMRRTNEAVDEDE